MINPVQIAYTLVGDFLFARMVAFWERVSVMISECSPTFKWEATNATETIHVTGLRWGYGKTVEAISLMVQSGEISASIEVPSGSGKTMLINSIIEMLKPMP